MYFLKVYKNDYLILREIEPADSFLKRFMGLMFRKSMPPDSGLLLSPCNAIHTFSMRFPIDVVYLDDMSTIVYIEKSMRPNKIGKTIKKAASVLELNMGVTDKLDLDIGDKLVFIR